MAKKIKLIKPVRSINELLFLAKTDILYEKLAVIAANNLGGDVETLAEARVVLNMNAGDTDVEESALVDEINFCRDLIVA